MINYRRQAMVLQTRQAKRKPGIVLQILIFIGIFLGSALVSDSLMAFPMAFIMVMNPGVSSEQIIEYPAAILLSLFMTAITTFVAIAYCLWIEKRSGQSMGFCKKTLWSSYGKGLLIGTALILLCAGFAQLLGGFRTAMAPEISVGLLFLFFLGFVIQGSSEEILVRGYFMMSFSNRAGMAVAVGVSSIIFSLLHIFNPGFSLLPLVNIALFGVFMGVYVLREGDLWGVCAIHTAWNFVQGNILGIQVSGTASMATVVRMLPTEGKELINGGSFGIEGSLIVTFVLLAATALTLFLPQKEQDFQSSLPNDL